MNNKGLNYLDNKKDNQQENNEIFHYIKFNVLITLRDYTKEI